MHIVSGVLKMCAIKKVASLFGPPCISLYSVVDYWKCDIRNAADHFGRFCTTKSLDTFAVFCDYFSHLLSFCSSIYRQSVIFLA